MNTILAAVIVPLAIVILISGIDDLWVALVCLSGWLRGSRYHHPSDRELHAAPEKRLAIFVPCWHESRVISHMVAHNVAAISYHSYDFFVGAYPNDQATVAAVRELEERFPNVHLAVCPHDGPTSKADCLNWIYQRMLLFEEDRGVRFDAVLTHDAEDLVHPEAMRIVSFHLSSYDMVQIPVLALRTPFLHLTHALYCDDFAEFQLKDMRVRGLMRSFIPSNGVGTAYSRAALESLAESDSNRIFEPECLTEDYENGIRLHRLGIRQLFVPVAAGSNGLIATREYFPRDLNSAIRQRTRWVTGIALQSWERHGWRGTLPQSYWFWRDRKGLIGSPLSLLTNIVFFAGAATWFQAKLTGHSWGLLPHLPIRLLLATTGLQAIHLSIRMGCVARIYGWLFALGVPLRTMLGNYINAHAAVRATIRFAGSRIRHQPLVWVKTEHAYPSREALMAHRRKLGEVLVGSGYISDEQLEFALATQPPGVRLGEHLVQTGIISDEELYEALSLQQSVPAVRLSLAQVNARVARSLPREAIREWKVLPFRTASQSLFLASPEVPTEQLHQYLRGFTRMDLRFHLITPANFAELAGAIV